MKDVGINSHTYDVVIIGAGIVGLSVAYNIKKKYPDYDVLILEKEEAVAQHQTGNNSGVIHSGIYYKPGSLKAKNCIDGYNMLLEFSREHQIPFDLCGKIIVATSNQELPALDNIYQRGIENGLEGIKKIDSEEISEREPHCKGVKGIWVPQTGIVDYKAFSNKLLELFMSKGGEIQYKQKVIKIDDAGHEQYIHTTKKSFSTKKIISCAGLFSDRVSQMGGGDNDLRIIPFRGEYYKLKDEKQYLVNNLIYPVPDPAFPFLGVHFTRMIGGGVEAGPNAVLAFKREGYKFSDFNAYDLSQTLMWPGFWEIVRKYGVTGMGEMYRSLSKKAFVKALQKLIPEITVDDLESGGAGVRAQACDRKGNLIDDFNVINKGNSIHVRNAPSPAATASLAIGRHVMGLL